jgi:hypothetical protein
MSDEIPTATPIPEPEPEPQGQPESQSAGEAWDDVVVRMNEFGEAVSRWAKASANDPRNKERLGKVREGFDEVARKAEAAFDSVAESDVGRQVGEGAQKVGQAVGDAAQQVSQAAAPHVAKTFAGLADAFGKAAAKVDESVSRKPEPAQPDGADAPIPPAPPVPPIPTNGEE